MIEIRDLQKVVAGVNVLEVKRLSVSAGEAAAVIGPPGSGKSELLSLLIGRSRPTSGMVSIAGHDPSAEKERLSEKMGVLFAENGLYERMSAQANLAFYCKLRGLPGARAEDVLVQVGLADHAAVHAGRLAPGLARRLAFGRAILHNPSILLLVNPFAGCDSASCSLLSRLVNRLADAGAASLILDTETSQLAHLGWTIYTIERGRLTKTPASNGERRIEFPFKVPARQEGRVTLVNPADILYACTEEGQTCLYTVHGSIASHLTLGEVEERLVHNGFFRAHRGYLVNLQRAKAIIPYTRDSFTLILDDPSGTEIPLSKSAARELRENLGY